MRLPLAHFSLATLFIALLGANTSGQTAPDTIKICRGISIPEGYTIIAESTSPDCPKGAYLIKAEIVGSGGRSSPSQASSGPELSRPRRVGRSAPLAPHEADQRTPKRPPTLASATTGVSSTPRMQTASATLPETEPEEIGEGDVVRVNTTLVTVPVSVVDRQGRYIPHLRREDFRLFENGVEQEIAYFDSTEKPFTVALLLDTSGSTRFHLWEIKEAAITFANQLRPDDRVLVVTFNDEVLLLTEATNDREVIEAVITYNARTGNATRLYDAIDLVIRERLSKIAGRKAIVLFTDGVDTASQLATYESTIHEAEELDALIYPIQYDTYEDVRAQYGSGGAIVIGGWPFPGNRRSSGGILNWPSPGGGTSVPGASRAAYARADRYLHELAGKTGARLYRADDAGQLRQAFTMIAEELRRQYSIGYYPKTPPSFAGERRQIKVRVRQPNFVVRARDSYIHTK